MLLVFTYSRPAFSQFSPGDLSRSHQALEGSKNCTQCHEVGNEISGLKCLSCHEEIQSGIDAKKGFHFNVSSDKCISCHKEHLGRDAKTVLFEEKKFDHKKTGFMIDGKHIVVKCAQCHGVSKFQSQIVRNKIAEYPHTAYVGLNSACVSCHEDPHRKQFSQECASCHNTTSWSQVKNFDHSKTHFALVGKHGQVACSKCHPGITKRTSGEHIDFKTVGFADCTPCHSSPHVSSFSGKTCTSCHNAEEWVNAMKTPFDHRMTRYRLEGKHATIRCEQCHRPSEGKKFSATFLLPFRQCTDCHKDRHNGEFAQRYKNNCATCHTEEGYTPSTFTFAQHNKSRFALTGAHSATLCSVCHRKTDTGVPPYHFNNIRCEACHTDVHKGQFASQMKVQSCGQCHTTERWTTASFDHSKTSFPLSGKHAQITCTDCHKNEDSNKGKQKIQFQKIPTTCESCHRDVHQKQFAVNVKTRCETCHGSEKWQILPFNHETQSRFGLTGAHKKVPCSSCHKQESLGNVTSTRYKPLSIECESCHKQGSVK